MVNSRAAPLLLGKNKYGVGISWDAIDGVDTIDLDLQAVIVDESGLIIDAVYYNNPEALNGAVSMAGDERTGNSDGCDESVWVKIDKIPRQVKLIIFVISTYNQKSLKDVAAGKILIFENYMDRQIKELKMEKSHAAADVICMIKRCMDGFWALVEIDEPAEHGSHFLDILEPNIGNVIRKEIKGAPEFQKVTFMMEKGAAVDFPETSTLKRLFVGIGGKLPAGSRRVVDIDISAVFFDKTSTYIGAVDGDRDSLFGVSHSGDNIVGSTIGDDEAICIDLIQVPKQVEHIFILLSINNGTFKLVESAYCRIIDQMGAELVKHEVTGNDSHSGLVVARLFRNQSQHSRWSCQAIGKFVDKKLAREEMKGICGEGLQPALLTRRPKDRPPEVKKGCRLSVMKADPALVRPSMRKRTRCVTALPSIVRESTEEVQSPRTTTATHKSMVSFAEPDPAEFADQKGSIVMHSISGYGSMSSFNSTTRSQRKKGTITLSTVSLSNAEHDPCHAAEEDSIPVDEDTDGNTRTSRCGPSPSWACNPFSKTCSS